MCIAFDSHCVPKHSVLAGESHGLSAKSGDFWDILGHERLPDAKKAIVPDIKSLTQRRRDSNSFFLNEPSALSAPLREITYAAAVSLIRPWASIWSNFTDTRLLTPCSCIVTPYSTSAICIVRLLCVMMMNWL